MKTVKFYEMEEGKMYFRQTDLTVKFKAFYKVTPMGDIVRTAKYYSSPAEIDNDALSHVTLNLHSKEIKFIEWEEQPFQPTAEDWQELKECIIKEKEKTAGLLKIKPGSSYFVGSVMAFNETLETMETMERIKEKKQEVE